MMGCSEVDKFIHPYVDGEFAAAESAQIEQHLLECQRCRELVAFHQTFKANLRARLRRPMHEVPEALRARVMTALDRADGRGAKTGWRRVMPLSGALVAAACAAFFLLRTVSSHADAALIEEAVRAHTKKLPVEVGGTEEDVNRWMIGKVSVPVRPPRIRCGNCTVPVTMVGARIYHLRDRDVAQLFYRVGGSSLSVYVFDPTGWDMTTTVSRMVGDHEVYLGRLQGYNVVLYRDSGVGYAFTSDLDHDEIIKLVSHTLRPASPADDEGEE